MSSKENNKLRNEFDELTQPVLRLSNSLDEITHLMELIRQSNDELITFNHSFGTFLHAMAGTNYINERTFNDGIQSSINKNLENLMPATRSPVVAHKPPAKTVTIDHPKKVTKRVSTDHSANIGRKKRKDDHLLSKMEQEHIKDLIDKLPLEIREDPEYLKNVHSILRLFFIQSDGFTLKDMANQSKVPQFRVTKCINALIHAKVVKKTLGTQKGQYSKFELLTGQKHGF